MSVNSSELLASNAALSGEVQRTREELKIAQLTSTSSRWKLAYLRAHEVRQLQRTARARSCTLDGTAPPRARSTTQQRESNVASLEAARKQEAPGKQQARRPARAARAPAAAHGSAHRASAAATCAACGGGMREIGQDVCEELEYVPGSFKVIRHVRPKLACVRCSASSRPARPAARSSAACPAPGCWRTCW